MKSWLALAALIALPSDQPAAHFGGRVLLCRVDHPDFGGFSAIEVTADGLGFLALTDRGVIFPGKFNRRTDGTLASLGTQAPVYLQDETGATLGVQRNDTEGLAQRPDGSFLVSLEGPAEVLDYDFLGGPAVALPQLHPWRALRMNAGLEAIAVDKHGFILTLPERAANNFYSVHEFGKGRWTASRAIFSDGGFLPVAADFGPDGRLYLLERRFVFPGGFAARMRRFSGLNRLGDVIWHSPPGALGNLEGLSVWQNRQGKLIATMISDDNFLGLFQTELVEITIGD